jgi:hypothetical protein
MAAMVLTVMLAAAGCSQDEVQEFRAARSRLAGDPGALDGKFRAELVMSRRVSKSGRPIGVGDEFLMKGKSEVNGTLTVENVELDRVYALNFLWIKPDQRDVFGRYYEVVVTEKQDGAGYLATITRKKLDDKEYRRVETQERDTPSFVISNRLNTSLAKERPAGLYHYRVYLHREFLLEEPFTLTPMELDGEA